MLLLLPVMAIAQNPLYIPDTLAGSVINLNLQMGMTSFYPGTPTNTMGANGNLLGPTLILNKHQQVMINVKNQLMDTTTIHWHGMHVAPENDGGPHTYILPNATWSPSFKVLDWAATYWYHPHLHHHTNMQVLMGISGFIIVRDSAEAALNLPRKYGVDDFPLVIQTKEFDANNQIVMGGVMDTALMVNGTLKPFLNAPAQYVRLRLLNGSSERTYNLGFTGNKTFYQIASDGGLLNVPVPLTRLRLSNGERAEILVDLSSMTGQTIYLMNYGSELANGIYGAAQAGMGPGQSIPGYSQNPLNGGNYNILQLNVVSPTTNPVTTMPANLITHNPWSSTAANTTRILTFTAVNAGPTAVQGPFLINSAAFDMMTINYTIPFNNTEIWELRNQTPIAHPFHIHDVQFYLLDINGSAPPANQQGKKDVILVPGGNGVVRFITKFENHYNDTVPYMYHCHMLPHEDGGMMGQFVVQSPPTGVEEVAAAPELIVYPNPVQHSFQIRSGTQHIYYSLSLYDLAGRTIFSGRVQANKDIDMSAVPGGIYMAALEDANSVVHRFKLVKE